MIKTKGEEEIDLVIYFERNLPFSFANTSLVVDEHAAKYQDVTSIK